jgi:hypothetical protein
MEQPELVWYGEHHGRDFVETRLLEFHTTQIVKYFSSDFL